MAMNKAAKAAMKRNEAARKASLTRTAKQFGMTREEWVSLTGEERWNLIYEQLKAKKAARLTKQRKKRNASRMQAGRPPIFEEPPSEHEEEPLPPPPEFEDEEDDIREQIGNMSAKELVVFMLGLMPDSTAQQNLRKLLAEIPSDDYPLLAMKLYSTPEAMRNDMIIRYHEDIVNQRRAAEQEFMKSKEFEEEVGGAVDPKSWM